MSPTYDLPVFRDSLRRNEAVSITGPDSSKTAAVLFATKDGGVTWKADRFLNGLDPGAFGERIASTVTDSTWIVPVAPSASKPKKLRQILHGSNVEADVDMQKLGDAPSSFVDPTQGWVATSKGLFSTTDGGQTWKEITPRVSGNPTRPGTLRMMRQEISSPMSKISRGSQPLVSLTTRGISHNIWDLMNMP